MTLRSTRSDQVRKKIEDARIIAEEDRKRKLLSQRLVLARTGVQAYQKNDLGTAIKSFVTYLKILEDLKGVEHGGLTPQHFDSKLDFNELVMINGVYWDLCKIYDRVKVENKDFQQYMRKYIQFTKGMPFQSVSAETLRKYIANGKAKHAKDFKAAYKILGTSRCFVVSSLVDLVQEPTLPVLRSWRDQFLARRGWGRAFITHYYRLGPQIASLLDRAPLGIRLLVARLLDLTARLILISESKSRSGRV